MTRPRGRGCIGLQKKDLVGRSPIPGARGRSRLCQRRKSCAEAVDLAEVGEGRARREAPGGERHEAQARDR